MEFVQNLLVPDLLRAFLLRRAKKVVSSINLKAMFEYSTERETSNLAILTKWKTRENKIARVDPFLCTEFNFQSLNSSIFVATADVAERYCIQFLGKVA